MKKHYQMLLSLVLLLSMMAAAVPAIAQEGGTAYTVQVDGLFVYENPDANSRLIAVLSLGTSVTRFAEEVNGFTRIRIPNGAVGWAVLGVSGVPTGQVVEVANADGQVSLSGVLVQSVDNVRIRTAPSLNATRIGLIGWGEIAQLLAVDASGKWYQINYDGLVGWVWAAFFRDVTGAPLVDVNFVGEDVVDPTFVVDPSTGGSNGVMVRSLDNVRIRTAPNLNAARIGLIGWGEVALLLGFDATGKWINISYDGIEGWAFGAFFEVFDGVAVTDLADDHFVVQPTNAGGVLVRSLANVRLRSGPSLSASQIDSIGWGDTMPLLAISSDDAWIQVNYNGVIGWAAAAFFELLSFEDGVDVVVVDTGDDEDDKPAPPVYTGTVPGSSGVMIRSLANLNVRASYSTNADRIGSLAWGDVVDALAYSPNGQWLLINHEGLIGWVAGGYFEVVQGNVGALPTVE